MVNLLSAIQHPFVTIPVRYLTWLARLLLAHGPLLSPTEIVIANRKQRAEKEKFVVRARASSSETTELPLQNSKYNELAESVLRFLETLCT